MIEVYHKDRFHLVPPGKGFDPAVLQADSPSAHVALFRGEAVAARCSLWWEGVPLEEGKPLGTVGHFQAEEGDDARILLDTACALLAEQGCVGVLAPMNGNTWRSYRYATGGMDRPPFLLEPSAARGRDVLLLENGFLPANRYHSYLEELTALAGHGERLARLGEKGISIRSLEPDTLLERMEEIYAISCRCFAQNPYFTPINKESFVGQYLQYRALLIPQLILFAEKEGETVGFLFALPDYLESQDKRPETVLLKTIAVLPEYRSLGMGRALVDSARENAFALGFSQAIYALIYQGNSSERLAAEGGLLREYTLYRKPL